MTPLLEVTGLRLRAGSAPVVDGVSFALGHGESVALVGASGSGKTTTALAVLGRLRDGITWAGGTVRVAGHDVLPDPPPGLRGGTVGYLGQDPGTALNPYRRVSAQLLAALGRRRTDRAAVAELLGRVGLAAGLAGRYPHQLSGGQQQRVALAVALARRPRLLVLDEPTSALDVGSAAEIRPELAGHRAAGGSLLWITHDLTAVAGLVDRVVVLDRGRLVEDAAYSRLLDRPESAAGTALVTAAGLPDRVPADRLVRAGPGLTARDLVAGYPGGGRVLDGVALDAAGGQCLAVLGVSGVGKSTLARCLVGLHRPVAGSVRLDGTPLAPSFRQRSREQRAAVQLVAQDPASTLHPRHDVRTTLSRPLRLLRGMKHTEPEIGRLLDLVGLPAKYVNRLPSELSGGERQRVALARALAARPRVLVCDEITSALDTVTQAAVLDLLGHLRDEQNLAIVLITHSPQVTRHLADRVLVLADGRAVGGEALAAGSAKRG